MKPVIQLVSQNTKITKFVAFDLKLLICRMLLPVQTTLIPDMTAGVEIRETPLLYDDMAVISPKQFTSRSIPL